MAREITQENPKVNNLVNRIEMGEVKIPPLQRPFVWKVEQIIELLESIYRDYPIGSILWWETNEKLPSERTIAGFKLPDKPDQHPFYYVLDGQQRLSSLYGVFCKNRSTIDAQDKDYFVDTKIFNISFDLTEKKFIHSDSKLAEHRYFDLKGLFDMTAFADAIRDAKENDQDSIKDLYDKFANYEVPIVITKKRSREEVGMIFERVNNTGTSLDLFDLMVALTWTNDFHLQKEFKSIQNILENKNFKGIKNKIILQCLSGIIEESSGVRVITSLNSEKIRQSVKTLEESLRKTVDYLSTELSVKSIKLLPHAHQIVPLCYFFSRVTTPTSQQKKVINRWFWKSSFSQRYSASTDTHIDEDIASFKNLVDNKDGKAFTKLAYDVTAEQLRETKFSGTNAYSRAFVVLLASNNPKNLVNGVFVDTGEALSAFNKREYHHVFPRAFLEGKSNYKDKLNSLCNFCLLPADSNKKILDKAPSDYFKNVIPQDTKSEIMESNLLPIKNSIYEKDNYDQFLEERSYKVLEYIEKKLIE